MIGPDTYEVPDAPAAIPAATVVIIRDGTDGLETLMVHKAKNLRSFAGAWVFPGGRVDAADRAETATDLDASRRAAVREAREEADLVLDETSLVPFAHWEPPPYEERRFSTWFFLAPGDTADVTVDGGEIHDHAWMRPADALARRDTGEIDLVPPTFVSLWNLVRHDSVVSAFAWLRDRDPEHFVTHIGRDAGGRVAALWAGDAGYDTRDADLPGPRHRLWLDGHWVYDRTVP